MKFYKRCSPLLATAAKTINQDQPKVELNAESLLENKKLHKSIRNWKI